MAGGGKQTTTSTNEPYAAAQPALNSALAQAQNLNSAGVGAQPYTGSTVIPWSYNTNIGRQNLDVMAGNNVAGKGLSGNYQRIINSGGFNEPQMESLANTRAVANSDFNINEDPAFQQVFDKTRDAVNMNAAGAGRYGSGSHQGVLTQGLGDLGARQYQAWQGRRDAANANVFNMGQTGQGNMASAYQNMQLPAQTLMQTGAMDEDLAKRYKDDELRLFNEYQNKPWENVSRLNAIASGAGSLGGTQTTSQPGQNPFLTALGYGTSGLGLLGSFL